MTQIFCAIDDTEPCEKAADVAISLARQLSAGLLFYMVNPAILSRLRVRKHLEKALRRARQAGIERVSCETHREAQSQNSAPGVAEPAFLTRKNMTR